MSNLDDDQFVGTRMYLEQCIYKTRHDEAAAEGDVGAGGVSDDDSEVREEMLHDRRICE